MVDRYAHRYTSNPSMFGPVRNNSYTTVDSRGVGHGHVTYEFIWRFTILNCVLGSL